MSLWMHTGLKQRVAAMPVGRPQERRTVLATSAEKETFTAMYYIKAALAGGICCS
jgi:hypothetical protein